MRSDGRCDCRCISLHKQLVVLSDALSATGAAAIFRSGSGACSIRHSSRHVYNTTVPTACLPHTGFAGVWTPVTHAELICHRTIHIHGSKRTSGFDSPHAYSIRVAGQWPSTPIRGPPAPVAPSKNPNPCLGSHRATGHQHLPLNSPTFGQRIITPVAPSNNPNPCLRLGPWTGKKVLRILQSVFSVAHKHIAVLSTAWKQVLCCILQLNSGNLKLLPPALVELDDFVDSEGRPLASTVALLQQNLDDQKGKQPEEAATVSFLSLIWGGPGGSDEDMEKRRKEDVEALAHAKMIVAQCKIDDLFQKSSRNLSIGSISGLVTALVDTIGAGAEPALEAGAYGDSSAADR